jgi:hypothetical protein
VTKALFAAGARAASLALVTVALVAGCSSTTSGSGSSGGFGTGGSGGSATGGATGSSAPTGGSGGSGGGGASATGNFCHDWSTISADLTDVTSGNVAEKLVAKFDSLAAEAPAAIKTDVQNVDAYVHGVVSGKVDTGKAQQLATAFEHIGQWMAQNC